MLESDVSDILDVNNIDRKPFYEFRDKLIDQTNLLKKFSKINRA